MFLVHGLIKVDSSFKSHSECFEMLSKESPKEKRQRHAPEALDDYMFLSSGLLRGGKTFYLG